MKKHEYLLDHGGSSYPVLVTQSGADVWVTVNDHTFKAEKSAGFKKGVKSQDSGRKIMSPMPGKISKIFKSVGDQVQVGEPVIVVEAMKMEYSLKATVAGVIDCIHFSEGSQVSLNAVLVELK